jgi:oxygen-independent coproporphyrinogen-3 oxidase
MSRLKQLELDGLVALRPDGIDVLPVGRLLIRNVCMIFDAYLAGEKDPQRYSRVI